MAQKFIRVYKKMDILEIKAHLLIYGDISANCANCQEINIKLDARKCPGCSAEFRYIAFRNIRSHMAKLPRLTEERPDIILVDYEDFSRHLGALKAEEFLK